MIKRQTVQKSSDLFGVEVRGRRGLSFPSTYPAIRCGLVCPTGCLPGYYFSLLLLRDSFWIGNVQRVLKESGGLEASPPDICSAHAQRNPLQLPLTVSSWVVAVSVTSAKTLYHGRTQGSRRANGRCVRTTVHKSRSLIHTCHR